MRTVFMGSPEFALPSLSALANGSDLVGVVTQPDRRGGRGRQWVPNPVKRWATAQALDIYQPESVNTPDAVQRVSAWQPDLVVVAAYGQILRTPLLDIPRLGCINVHASLLPRWRGAAPVQAAILAGDAQTGVTLMRMDPGMDTGPVLAQASLDIGSSDTGGVLTQRLAELGGEFLESQLPAIANGEVQANPQDESLATYAPLLKKQDGQLDFTQSAERLARQVRAFEPWPGSYFIWDGLRVVVRQAHAATKGSASPPGVAGEHADGTIVIGTPSGDLVLDRVQPAGKTIMSGRDFLNGARAILGNPIHAPNR